MADSPCAQAALEYEEASRSYATAVNAVRRLTTQEPKGAGAKRQAWESELSEARRVRDSALVTYREKEDALQKCKSEHGEV